MANFPLRKLAGGGRKAVSIQTEGRGFPYLPDCFHAVNIMQCVAEMFSQPNAFTVDILHGENFDVKFISKAK